MTSAGDEDDVEAPPTVATPAAPVATPSQPSGIFIPKWVGLLAAAIVAALVFGGIGYAIGDSSGDSDSRNASVLGNDNGTSQLPGNGTGPFGNGSGQLPGNGNGNGQTNGNTAFLGVALENATNGAGITEVQSGSPAANAGLQTGDVITAVDGTNVADPAALVSAIHQHSSGDQITITYTRAGKSATAKVTLASRSSGQSS